MFGIGFKLFTDSTEFEKGLVAADKGIEGMEKTAKKLGIAFGGWKIASDFLLMGLDSAKKLRDESEKIGIPIDDATKSVAKLADAFDSIKTLAANASSSTLGWLTGIGEAFGEYVVEVGGYWEKLMGMNMRISTETGKAIEEQTDKTLSEITKRREKFADDLKKSQDDLAVSRKKLTEIEEQDTAKILRLYNEQNDALKVIIESKEGSLRHNQALVKINEAEAEIIKTKKKLEEEHTKALAEHQKIVEEMNKAEMLGSSEMLEMIGLQQKKLRGLTEDESSRLKVLELQVKQKRIEVEVENILADGTVTEQEKKRLGVLYTQKEELNKQIEAQQKLKGEVSKTVAEEEKRTKEMRTQLSIVGKDNDEMSDLALKAKSEELRKDIFRRELDAQGASASVGGDYYDPLLSFQKNQLAAVEKEMADRKRVASLVGQYGEEKAFTFFGGSAGEFERLAQSVSNKPEDSKNLTKLATATDEINERLRKAGFSK